MKWTLNQASHATGVSKATILRAIRSGRMTAPKDELNQYAIDPSEFYRVFPAKPVEPADEPGTRTRPDRGETPNETGWLEAEVQRLSEALKTMNLERDRERGQLEGEVRFLRSRVEHADQERDAWFDERKSLTARLLTYQPAPPDPSAPVSPPSGASSGPGEAGPAAVPKRGFLGMFRKAG